MNGIDEIDGIDDIKNREEEDANKHSPLLSSPHFHGHTTARAHTDQHDDTVVSHGEGSNTHAHTSEGGINPGTGPPVLPSNQHQTLDTSFSQHILTEPQLGKGGS